MTIEKYIDISCLEITSALRSSEYAHLCSQLKGKLF